MSTTTNENNVLNTGMGLSRIIGLLVLVLILGVGAGYLLFGGQTEDDVIPDGMSADDHQHSGGEEGTVWTCSMHPQIQRDEPGDCPICGMDLIPMSAGSDDPAILTMTEASVAMARVQTTVLGDVQAARAALTSEEATSIAVSGRLATDEARTATQTAHVPGRIERLYVDFAGERIKAGQKIAEVYSPELVSAQEELLQARKLSPDSDSKLLSATRAKLRNLRIRDALIDEILASGEIRDQFPLYADVTGVVIERRVALGDYVRTGETLYTLANLDELYAEFDLYEEQLGQVRTGDKVTFSTPAAPGQVFSGRVKFIDPFIDPSTRTATVRAVVSNRSGKLKPSMLIRGELVVRPMLPKGDKGAGESPLLLVPRTAVLWTGKRSVVYVEVPNSTVPTYEFREVELADRVGDAYVVTEGLAAGEAVVKNGAFSIDAAAQLNNQLSMMNRDVLVEGQQPRVVSTSVVPDYRASTTTPFKDQLGVLAKAYLPVKNALVDSDLPSAKSSLLGFGESLKKVDMGLLKGDAHLYWMDRLVAIQTHSKALKSSNELEEGRRQFAFLSQALIDAITAFGVSRDQYFVDYCPMALDNQGANWLSEQAEIRNPFFGEAMLTCGSLIDTLGD